VVSPKHLISRRYPQAMTTAYIAIGSNLDGPAQRVDTARLAAGGIPQTRLVAVSSLYESSPVDAGGEDYVNAVLKVETHLNAYELLAELQRLEGQAGRALPQDRAHLHNAPRTLDLDILLYGDARIESATLTVPHPRMWIRAFVLVPLHEIAPELVSAEQLAALSAQVISRLN
jgi:2-amino-4-hydroxy-6-hydroxymethyldihydropteridine diphosphokinase